MCLYILELAIRNSQSTVSLLALYRAKFRPYNGDNAIRYRRLLSRIHRRRHLRYRSFNYNRRSEQCASDVYRGNVPFHRIQREYIHAQY